MINELVMALFLISFQACAQQNRTLGGRCEGCEAIFEHKGDLQRVDTLPGFSYNEFGLKIHGTVFEKDGKTPAKNVIIYIYHTDENGVYPSDGNGWGKRHGKHRGWVETGVDGKYIFFTFRPAPYQNLIEPAHIHLVIKERDLNPYYLDDYLFEDDPLLSDEYREKQKNRGGSGIVSVVVDQAGLGIVKRDIFLGQNIPGYDE